MSYIQITNRCNMHCRHCCFSCTSKGNDMTRKTFLKAIEIAADHDSYVTIGGGEPTLHPFLFDFLGIALSVFNEENGNVYIVTNGKEERQATKLAQMASLGIIGARLSQDKYHEPIDPQVVSAFKRNPNLSHYGEHNNDHRDISYDVNLVKRGRSKLGKNKCACNDTFIDPQGRIFACGCRKVQYGTVFDPQIPEEYSYWEEKCSYWAEKNFDKEKELLEA